MNPWPVEAAVAEVHLPRPGHADLVGTQKYGITDVRNILERASARETAARVAGGAVAKAFLRELGVEVFSPRDPDHERASATTRRPDPGRLRRTSTSRRSGASTPTRPSRWSRRSTASGRRTSRSEACSRSIAFGLIPGLGSHVSWEERLDGRLGQAVLSIQAIKAVSIGDGAEVAGLPGSAGPRRDLLQRPARLLPRDQPRRRARGRDDDRRAARRARVDEAAPDADQAAPLGRHRHPRAGRGAPGADRLVHGARRRRGGGGDGRVRARRRLPAQVRRRPHRRRPRGASTRTRNGSRGGAGSRSNPGRSAQSRLHRVHGRRQDDRRPERRARARRGPRRRRQP